VATSEAQLNVDLLGDCAVRFEIAATRLDLAALKSKLLEHDALLALVPTCDSLTLRFAPGVDLPAAARRAELALQQVQHFARQVRLIEIPLVDEPGEDLAALAEHARLTSEGFLTAFCALRFEVAHIGFQPGFPYLLGLPEAFKLDRRATPRARVPAGSVAIGGAYAGIYPNATPGGWHLLGRTETRLFDVNLSDPSLLAPGDHVRFVR